MRTTRRLLPALVAALALATTADAALATRLGVSNRFIRAVFVEVEGVFRTTTLMRCPMTLEGSFHGSTFAKTAGALVGFINRAAIGHPCPRFGEAFILNGTEVISEGVRAPNTLPWHIRYESFSGSLPNITGVGVQIIGASVLVTFIGSCLYVSTAEAPMRGRVELSAEGVVTGFRLDPSAVIPKASGGGFCPPTMQLAGTGRVTQQGTESPIGIGLV